MFSARARSRIATVFAGCCKFSQDLFSTTIAPTYYVPVGENIKNIYHSHYAVIRITKMF